MRLEYELGFANASLFTHDPITFLCLNGISFARPAPYRICLPASVVHGLLVVLRKLPYLAHVSTRADVVKLETGTELRTDDFRFIWCRDPPLFRMVAPKTHGDRRCNDGLRDPEAAHAAQTRFACHCLTFGGMRPGCLGRGYCDR
ncbi:hypothetical protein BV20DRAFT_965198 [Pilatotrama ljubarskyi]|nr:hypothetical protein BV20DRAFT_965198 [Pilatotrama ljubarskyi]